MPGESLEEPPDRARSGAELAAVAAPAPIATKLCPDNHPNDPDAEECRICDRRFEGGTEVVALEPRSVARLLLEDGSAVDVADSLMIGRSPIGSEGVDTLTVTGRQVSRRHLLLEARGWQLYVMDCDSTNGTFLTRRGEKGRRRVPVDEAIPVRIGDSIHFGSRQALVVQARTS
ncbi:MAG: FHA domain-containing protein [Acidimicrobiales bacterium]